MGASDIRKRIDFTSCKRLLGKAYNGANGNELNARIYRLPTSAIKLNGKKLNYYDFLMESSDADCNAALARIVPRIDQKQMERIIDDILYISDLQKEFYKIYLNARYQKILLPAYKKM